MRHQSGDFGMHIAVFVAVKVPFRFFLAKGTDNFGDIVEKRSGAR
jgi:hypothetical protein